ncbi:hypothetical protein [Domibacillus enclensis]|uniref:Uncharacterized protein n=1 Tax=Domibacillus enclensis TaxID=1017273 RepID=A0A1N7C459_9BACI|nr:hypothetical protein [Domibacillus enclensis]OXS74232.1 hypothetical protein B1B05_17315 [Domibacillus enclensis]SIR58368.1 hypothetical protein SAMN05443094_11160 [Domibacillus enclensis]
MRDIYKWKKVFAWLVASIILLNLHTLLDIFYRIGIIPGETLLFINRFFISSNEEFELFSGILLGVTGGVISLIGLIAIFVSLNSQHKIQKCREIYWECIDIMQEKKPVLEMSDILNKKFRKYANIYESAKDFDKSIVFGSKTGIIIVLIVWACLIGIRTDLAPENKIMLNIFLIPIFVVILIFHRILGSLNDLSIIGKLNSTPNLLTINRDDDFRNILLAANVVFDFYSTSTKSSIEIADNYYQGLQSYDSGKLVAKLNIPLNRFRIYLKRVFIHDEESDETTDNYQIQENCFAEIDINEKEHSEKIDSWLDQSAVLNMEIIEFKQWDSLLNEYDNLLIPYANSRGITVEHFKEKVNQGSIEQHIVFDYDSKVVFIPKNIRRVHLDFEVRPIPIEEHEKLDKEPSESEQNKLVQVDRKNTILIKTVVDLQHSEVKCICAQDLFW